MVVLSWRYPCGPEWEICACTRVSRRSPLKHLPRSLGNMDKARTEPGPSRQNPNPNHKWLRVLRVGAETKGQLG